MRAELRAGGSFRSCPGGKEGDGGENREGESQSRGLLSRSLGVRGAPTRASEEPGSMPMGNGP